MLDKQEVYILSEAGVDLDLEGDEQLLTPKGRLIRAMRTENKSGFGTIRIFAPNINEIGVTFEYNPDNWFTVKD